MFVIMKQQMDAFQSEAERAFADDLVSHLRRRQAEDVENLPDPVLRRRVAFGIDRARSHGLTWRSSITAFVGLMLGFGPHFDQQPTIRSLLADPSVPPDRRVKTLPDLASDRDWEEALALGGDEAWPDYGPISPAPPAGG